MTKRRFDLADLYELCDRYVPVASRHPKARSRSTHDTWWPAHELGHLLTVPRARIGLPLFGMDADVSPFHPCASTWWAYELAAMHVSRRLLIACGRPDLFFGASGELKGTDWNLREYGSKALAGRILGRRRVLRLPSSREEFEAKLQQLTARGGAR